MILGLATAGTSIDFDSTFMDAIFTRFFAQPEVSSIVDREVTGAGRESVIIAIAFLRALAALLSLAHASFQKLHISLSIAWDANNAASFPIKHYIGNTDILMKNFCDGPSPMMTRHDIKKHLH